MLKTGWKYTKQSGGKSEMNMLKCSNAPSKPGLKAPKQNDSNMKDSNTIKHLKMYNNGKAIQNKEGTMVGRQFMMGNRAGDTKITGELFEQAFGSKSRGKHVKLDQLLINYTDQYATK
eukprot:1118277-Ditylum_brightwellii.AAC.1